MFKTKSQISRHSSASLSDVSIALYIQEGFIARTYTHPSFHNQATGLFAEFNNSSIALIVLYKRENNHPKITLIHVDVSMNAATVDDEMKAMGECTQIILYRHQHALEQVKTMLGTLFTEFTPIAIETGSRSFYLKFTCSIEQLLQQASSTPFLLTKENCGQFGLNVFDSFNPDSQLLYVKHPAHKRIETVHAIHCGFMTVEELKDLSYNRIIFNINYWAPISLDLAPSVKRLVKKIHHQPDMLSALNEIDSSRKKMPYHPSSLHCAVMINYWNNNFNLDELFIHLMKGVSTWVNPKKCKNTKKLAAQIQSAIKDKGTAFQRVSQLKEVQQAVAENNKGDRASASSSTPISKSRGKLYEAVMGYVGNCFLIYSTLAEKAGDDEKKTDLYEIAKCKEADAKKDMEEANYTAANNSYRYTLGMYQLLIDADNLHLRHCLLSFTICLCRSYFQDQTQQCFYDEAKSTLITFMTLTANHADGHEELLLLYEWISGLFFHTPYHNSEEEIKILEFIAKHFLIYTVALIKQMKEHQSEKLSYDDFLSMRLQFNLKDKSEEALVILANLLFHNLTKDYRQNLVALNLMLKMLASINKQTIKNILFQKFCYVFSVSFLDQVLEVPVISEKELVPMNNVFANLRAASLAADKQEDVKSLISYLKRFLLMILIDRAQFLKNANEHSQQEVFFFTERILKILFESRKYFCQHNVILHALYHHLLALISLACANKTDASLQFMQTVLADFHHYLTNQTQYADENEQQVVIRIWGRLFYIIYGEQQLQEFNLIGSNILFTFTQRLNRNILYIVFQAMNDHLKSQLDENNEEALTNNVKCNIQFLCQKAMADGVINIRHLRIALYLMNSLKILFILTQQDDAFKEINEQYKQTITTFYVAVANEVVDQLAVIADNIKQGQLLPELMLEIQSLCAKRGTDYDEFFQVSKRERIKILADMKNSQEFVLLAKEAMLSFEDQFNALFVLWDSQGRMPGEQAEKLKLLEQCMDLLIDIANFDNNGDVLLPQPPTTTFFIWRRTHELVVRSFAEAPDYISFFNTARMNSWDKTINDSDSSCESTDQDEPIISQVTHS